MACPDDRPAGEPDRDAALAEAHVAASALRPMVREVLGLEVAGIVEAAGTTMDVVRGPSRRAELVELRRVVAVFLTNRGCSLGQIGAILNRHHTTIINLLDPKCKRPRPRLAVVEREEHSL